VSGIVWNKADLHIHSSYSDGTQSIPEILAHIAVHTALNVLAITDHDSILGALEARKLAPRYNLEAIVGEEVSTARGHLLALFIHKLIPPGLSISETVKHVHGQGGLAILAHPLDRLSNSPLRHWPQPTWEDWLSFGLDGLEGFNSSQLDPLATVRTKAHAHQLGLALTGGSDAHHKGVIGLGHTLYQGSTATDLRRALEQRTCQAAGVHWGFKGYWHWLAQSQLPRTLGLRALPTPG
jgi:predicted metal-dependent phosphoesterase TrpH